MGLAAALKRESTYISAIARTLFGLRAVKPDSPYTTVDEVETRAREMPERIAFYFGDRTMTFAALNAGADRVAHWAKANGVGPHDVVALLMENRPEYVMTWLGLLKAGAVAALINTNLRGTPLAHSISIAGAKLAIV